MDHKKLLTDYVAFAYDKRDNGARACMEEYTSILSEEYQSGRKRVALDNFADDVELIWKKYNSTNTDGDKLRAARSVGKGILAGIVGYFVGDFFDLNTLGSAVATLGSGFAGYGLSMWDYNRKWLGKPLEGKVDLYSSILDDVFVEDLDSELDGSIKQLSDTTEAPTLNDLVNDQQKVTS